jgi:hypothetical protein
VAYLEERDATALVGTIGTTDAASARLRWYREVATVLVFYAVYSAIRNLFGSNAVPPEVALRNAERVIRAEQAVSGFVEADLQAFFLGWGPGFMRFWNLYYGSLHFVVTAGVMVWLYHRHPAHYPRWRNTLGAMTALALVGFSLFPLMPPRLLGRTGAYGGGDAAYAGDFVDTLVAFPTLWSFESSAMQSVSNQYAAMPSLHVGWALWCVAAVLPFTAHRVVRFAFVVYVPATVFAIVVTANHYWLDAVGGVIVFQVAVLIAGRLELIKARRTRLLRPIADREQSAGTDVLVG